jgi:hypothetical protein
MVLQLALPINKFSKRRIFAAAMLTFLVLSSAPVFCRFPDSSLTGIVIDQRHYVVVGAMITIKGEGTDVELMRASDETGRYSIIGLQPGNYTAAVEAIGFRKFIKDGTDL